MKQKTLIFHIGCSAGFFSEYLEMIAAKVYCDYHNINFKLYSKDANFAIENGWTDIFEPFCEEVSESFHQKYNIRFKYPSLSRLIIRKLIKGKKIPSWCWEKFSIWYLKVFLTSPLYKLTYNFDYYTYDKWDSIQKFKTNNIQSKEYIDSINKTILQTWNFNVKIRNKIESITKQLNLPEKYIGTQIRAGDKSEEQSIYEFYEYIDKIESLNSSLFDIFVLTDDYDIINKIRKRYPKYKIFTLCEKHENGYNNDLFQKQNRQFKFERLLVLLASVEILWNSEILVGAINANPSLFFYNRNHHNSHWISK